MRIAIDSDHAGLSLKEDLSAYMRELGHDVVDAATNDIGAADYVDCAEAIGRALLEGSAERGVLVCGSGVGATIAANKLPGIRAGLCHDTYSARQGVEHDNMNVLVLGGRIIGSELAREILAVFLRAKFTAEERHEHWLQKVHALEEQAALSQIITPERYKAVLFDIAGVVTETASIRAACWKKMFDEFLQKWSARNAAPFRAFDISTDYKIYVNGKPRYHGVRDFLKSRGIILPEGTSEDPPTAETVCGLGNRKNDLLNSILATSGVKAYPGAVTFIRYVRGLGIKTAVVTSSQNCQAVLEAAKVDDLFDVRVDGDVLIQQGLAGKPAPDSFLKAVEMLGVPPQLTVVIEDGIPGIRAAAYGGFGLVIGLARKNNAGELRAHGADMVVHDLVELLNRAA